MSIKKGGNTIAGFPVVDNIPTSGSTHVVSSGGVYSALADKANTGHEVIEFQEPTSTNNYTWYRKYADGWVEQGGTCAADYYGVAVTFPVTMNDGNYQFQLSVGQGQLTGTVGTVVDNRTTTGMTVYTNYSAGTPNYICWQVSGIAAN